MSPIPRPLIGWGRALAARLPAPASDYIKEQYRRHLQRRELREHARADPDILRKWGVKSAPPPKLRLRVHGAGDLESFLAMGKANYEAIVAGLALAHRPIGAADRVLDFGCGSGRTLRWWLRHPQPPMLHGTDIDAAALRWVKRHLPVATYRNSPLPPLPFSNEYFDAIYAISVFTHLNEEFQDAWLAELRRILKPGGVALVSARSAMDIARCPAALQEQIAKQGIVFSVDGLSEEFFPSFYQSTYHSAGYIERRWGGYFDIVGKIPMGYQDLVIMVGR